MRLYVVRHGETRWNLENRFQGWADQPLSERGEKQAVEAARMLVAVPFDAAYSSDLSRARRTAEIILDGRGLEAVPVKGLREMDIGNLDGLVVTEIEERFPDLLKAWREDPQSVTMPGGETLEQVSERAWAAVEPIVERHRGETVLLVAHHTINKTIICRTLGIPLAHFRTLRQPPCAISVIDFSDMGTFVRAVNLNWREDTRSWIDLGNEVREQLLRVEGVAFDFDGVLLNSMPFYAAAWRGALVERGIAPPEIEFYRRESERGVNSARHFLEEAGQEASEEAIDGIIERVSELYQSYPGIGPYPGVLELVKKLHDAGRKLALVTGSPRADIDRFLDAEQQRLFDTIVSCGDVEHSKPDPEPYALARERLGLPAERVLAIENSPYGILSARGAGLLTAGMTTTLPATDLAGADFIIDSLERLPAWLGIQ